MILKNVVKLPLDIPKGYSVVCVMQTQAAYAYKVRLIDGKESDLITPMQRQSMQPLPPVCAEIRSFEGGECHLSIDVPQSQNIDPRIVHSDFTSVNGSLQVRAYTIVAEDAGDSDYNDLFLTITAYRTRG